MTGSSAPLTQYFETVFLPDVLADSERNTQEAYRKAVRKFAGWSGCDIQMHAVSDGILERFCRSIIADGISTKTARAYRVYLRRIVRHKYGDRCLKECGRRPHENNPVVIAGLAERDQDIEGSIYRFWRTEYVPRRMIGSRECSIDQYRYALNRFARFLGRVPMMADLNDENISGCMAWTLNACGLSKSSANGTRKHLLALWRYAVKRGLLDRLPSDVEKLKEPKRLPEAWTMEELGRIVEAARLHRTPKTGMTYPPGKFWPAIILTAYDTGLRIRAMLSVRRRNWDPTRRELTAESDAMKTGVSQVFFLSEQTGNAIQEMLANADAGQESPELLFPWPIRKDGIFDNYRRILKAAGVKIGPKNGFHKLRRTTATHLAAAVGMEAASRQLGHSSIEMTRRYVDPRFTAEHRAAENLPRPGAHH